MYMLRDKGPSWPPLGAWVVFALTVFCAHESLQAAQAGPQALPQRPMRALHLTGNWGDNVEGLKRVASSPLQSVSELRVSETNIRISRSVFTNNGVTLTNDVARVQFDIFTVGASHYLQASFRVVKSVDTGDITVRFSPSLDTLRDIPGFNNDVVVQAKDKRLLVSGLSTLGEPAQDFVRSVLAHSASFVAEAAVQSRIEASVSKEDVVSALTDIHTASVAEFEEYWSRLRSLNVEWLGLSLPIFYDSIGDPTVRVRYKPSGAKTNDIYSFDEDTLVAFIEQAKSRGFRIYLTVGFEPSNLPMADTDPRCQTPDFKMARFLIGRPFLNGPDWYGERCINPVDWWWNPDHPDYAEKTRQFWMSYTDVVVRYASLSERLGVDMFSLGSETANLFRTRTGTKGYVNHFEPQLHTLVDSVRQVYSGLVTMNQHFLVLTDPAQNSGGIGQDLFADLNLDVMAFSSYFHLSDTVPTRVLSVAELSSSWENVFERYLEPLHEKYPDLPIVFTELGYTDDVASPARPNNNVRMPIPAAARGVDGVTDGMRQQQNIYEAFFQVNRRHNDLVRGVFVFGFEVPAPRQCAQVEMMLSCKPALETLGRIYSEQ